MFNEFFRGCTTAEEVKVRYRQLCKQHHPDLGPQEEVAERTKIMQKLNLAYAQMSAMFHGEEMREKARQAGKPEPTAQDYTDAAAVDERIRAAIEKIITLDGLAIEICGLWVWVGGDTQAHRQELKAADFKWSSKKVMWYFAGIPAGGFRSFTIDEIRSRYGSQQVSARRSNADQRQPEREKELTA